MKRSRIILLLLVILLVIISLYTLNPGGELTGTDYVKHITEERMKKDHFMRTSGESPFKEQPYTGLQYFPPDEQYRITARFEANPEKTPITLGTSDGSESPYLKYGYAQFQLEGKENRLMILELTEAPNKGTLFIPFGDLTSAAGTYGGGRYLDLDMKPRAGTVVLDFNEAYNPYCAYSNGYVCPLPPPENLLQIAIRAGEKNYHD